MTVRVVVTATIPVALMEGFESAYLQVAAVMKGTPGLVGDELLRDVDQAGRYLLLSEWENEELFRDWESSAAHHDITAPMHPYWSGGTERRIFRFAAGLKRGDVARAA